MTYTINLKSTAVAIAVALTAALAIAGLGSTRAGALACDDCVSNNDLMSGAVTSAKIAQGTIESGDIRNGTIQTEDLGTASVRKVDIASNSVDKSELGNAVALGNADRADGAVTSDVTLGTTSAGSYQNLAGDLTLEGAAGDDSVFLSPIMGNLHGSTLTPTASGNDYVYHSGVVGAYNVDTSDTAGTKAGVIGLIGSDGSTTGTLANGFTAVIDSGDGSTATVGNAAYGVAYTSPASGTHFNYGLDLYHAAFSDVGGSSLVDYGTADIRLAAGTTISSGSANPSTCVTGSLFLDTDGGADATLRACTATNTWTAVSNE